MGTPSDRSAGYRVEHREGNARVVVATGTRLLDPLAAHLAAQGKGGYLAVVNVGTGELVIRYPLDRSAATPAPSA